MDQTRQTRKAARSEPAIKLALRASFPNYTGRKIRVENYVGPRSFDLYWSGGTRDELVLLDPAQGSAPLRVLGAPWANQAAFEPIDQPAGTILAVHTIFCGTDLGVTFIVRRPETHQLAPISVALLTEGSN